MGVYFDEDWKQWRYRTIVTMPDGSKVRISGTPNVNTKVQAVEVERDHILRTRNPPPEEKKAPPKVKTFATYSKEWLKTYPLAADNRPSVRRGKETIVRIYLAPALDALALDAIKGPVVTKLFASFWEKKLASQSIKNIRVVLRRMLASAVEDGELAALPVLPPVKVPRVADGKKWDWLRPEESDQLLAAARDDFERALLTFSLHTGARMGETRAVRWSDVDFRQGFITIRRSLVEGNWQEPKSGHGREVPITDGLAAALKKIKHERELIFSWPDGLPLGRDHLHQRLWTVQKHAKLRKFRWHDMRHTFCSQLIAAGVPMRQVQEWAGHSTIMVTERYSHLAPGAGKEQIKALDRPELPKLRAV